MSVLMIKLQDGMQMVESSLIFKLMYNNLTPGILKF